MKMLLSANIMMMHFQCRAAHHPSGSRCFGKLVPRPHFRSHLWPLTPSRLMFISSVACGYNGRERWVARGVITTTPGSNIGPCLPPCTTAADTNSMSRWHGVQVVELVAPCAYVYLRSVCCAHQCRRLSMDVCCTCLAAAGGVRGRALMRTASWYKNHAQLEGLHVCR